MPPNHNVNACRKVNGEPFEVEKNNICGRFWPGNGGGGSVVRLLEADHQSHSVRPALLGLPGIVRHHEPSVVDGEVVCGHPASESASGRDHIVAASGGKHGLGSAAIQATLPCRKFRSPVFLIRTAIVLGGGGSEGPRPGAGVGVAVVAVAARGRLSVEAPASATRRVFVALVFVALFARAARRASLAR